MRYLRDNTVIGDSLQRLLKNHFTPISNGNGFPCADDLDGFLIPIAPHDLKRTNTSARRAKKAKPAKTVRA